MVLCVGAFFARWNDAKVLLHWFHNATFAQLPQNWCFWFNIFFCHAPVFQLIAVSFYDWAAHKLRFLKNIPFYFYSISFLTGHFHCTTFSNWIKFKYSEPKVEFKYKLTSWLLVRGYWFMMAEHNSIIYNLICSWKKKEKKNRVVLVVEQWLQLMLLDCTNRGSNYGCLYRFCGKQSRNFDRQLKENSRVITSVK